MNSLIRYNVKVISFIYTCVSMCMKDIYIYEVCVCVYVCILSFCMNFSVTLDFHSS